MVIGFLRLIRREVALTLRQGTDAATAILFFVLCVVMFPFGIGPEPNILIRIAPGVILVAALLASLLSLDRLFLPDFEDGSLDLLTLSPMPLEFVVLAKVVAHWLTTGLPLILTAPILALMLNLPLVGLSSLIVSLFLATPLLSLIGAVGSALTLGARRGGLLMPLLVLPLYIPTLIFAAGAVDAGLAGLPIVPHLQLLAGMLVLALVLVPMAAAAALRAAIE